MTVAELIAALQNFDPNLIVRMDYSDSTISELYYRDDDSLMMVERD